MHNAALHWCDSIEGSYTKEKGTAIYHKQDRWMTASEHCHAMGFPTKNIYTKRCSSFTDPIAGDGGYDYTNRKRQVTVAQMGNSMHTAVVLSVFWYIMVGTQTVEQYQRNEYLGVGADFFS